MPNWRNSFFILPNFRGRASVKDDLANMFNSSTNSVGRTYDFRNRDMYSFNLISAWDNDNTTRNNQVFLGKVDELGIGGRNNHVTVNDANTIDLNGSNNRLTLGGMSAIYRPRTFWVPSEKVFAPFQEADAHLLVRGSGHTVEGQTGIGDDGVTFAGSNITANLKLLAGNDTVEINRMPWTNVYNPPPNQNQRVTLDMGEGADVIRFGGLPQNSTYELDGGSNASGEKDTLWLPYSRADYAISREEDGRVRFYHAGDNSTILAANFETYKFGYTDTEVYEVTERQNMPTRGGSSSTEADILTQPTSMSSGRNTGGRGLEESAPALEKADDVDTEEAVATATASDEGAEPNAIVLDTPPEITPVTTVDEPLIEQVLT